MCVFVNMLLLPKKHTFKRCSVFLKLFFFLSFFIVIYNMFVKFQRIREVAAQEMDSNADSFDKELGVAIIEDEFKG